MILVCVCVCVCASFSEMCMDHDEIEIDMIRENECKRVHLKSDVLLHWNHFTNNPLKRDIDNAPKISI